MTEFFPLDVPGGARELLAGVPFCVAREARCARALPYGAIPVGRACKALCFLGMVTRERTGECGWAGERFYSSAGKLFIGDILGRIDIHYAGNLVEAIPVIFGVNAWNYEMFERPMPWEYEFDPVQHEYPEPFRSDPEAARRLRDSLRLTDCRGDKYAKYVFAYQTRGKAIESVVLQKSPHKGAGFGISAVTAVVGECPLPALDYDFFVKKRYYPAMDALRRTLYQFLDALPSPKRLPPIPGLPDVAFEGDPEAAILTRVCRGVAKDLYAKMDEGGMAHTSTLGAPCYGFYSGIGTYKAEGAYNYHGQCWSRDTGRMLSELCELTDDEAQRAVAEELTRRLYDPCPGFPTPHWKRIVNASIIPFGFPENYDHERGRRVEPMPFPQFCGGKENDGHAALMLAIYKLYRHGVLSRAWLLNNARALRDAAEWFAWQMENPEQSGFDGVLLSESEASYGEFGGYELYSNHLALLALHCFSGLMEELSLPDDARRLRALEEKLEAGIREKFIGVHPRYGRVLVEPESDNWPSELKRVIGLLWTADLFGYDPSAYGADWYALWQNTYDAQREEFFSPRMGGSMGYGQSYQTQAALLLDRTRDFSACALWLARFCCSPGQHDCLPPEGVTCHPSGAFWYRHTDLGNLVQEAEVLKCARLMLGLDDLRPGEGLFLVPRLPDGFEALEALDYPIVAQTEAGIQRIKVDYRYQRTPGGYALTLSAEQPLRLARVRVGPFQKGAVPPVVRGDADRWSERFEGPDAWFYWVDIGREQRQLTLFVDSR